MGGSVRSGQVRGACDGSQSFGVKPIASGNGMAHGWGVMRSVNEIESVIGEGPFVLRHVRDVSRGHERGVCAL